MQLKPQLASGSSNLNCEINFRTLFLTALYQNDNGLYCHTPAELAVIKREGSPMGPLLLAVNTIAKALAPKYPNVAFNTLACECNVKPFMICLR